MDLESIAGPQWAGWTFHKGLLWAPGWRGGLHPGEIHALPYLHQLARERDRRADELQRENRTLARLARFYRSQLVLESRLGLALTRIAG